MYKVKGYAFNKENQRFELKDIIVNSYKEMFETLKMAGVEHYIFVLKEVK